jgi:hypothetical protein
MTLIFVKISLICIFFDKMHYASKKLSFMHTRNLMCYKFFSEIYNFDDFVPNMQIA